MNKAERTYTQQELNEEVLPVWKQRLRLQNWNISVEIVNQMVIGKDGTADIRFDQKYMNADIRLVTPESYYSVFSEKQDMLRDLIHELLHIHFLVFLDLVDKKEDSFSFAYTQAEQSLDIVANALVDFHDELQQENSDDSEQ